ncbi:MAG TPA: alpha-L-fucosidase [Myxococcota bacterium]|nr:alpha-L-fucosidase [Myxococcota bacterium]
MVAPKPAYEPTLASLKRHTAPPWYDEAKLGIFVHWTPASVIGFAPREKEINELLVERYDDMQVEVPYTEWYENSLRFPGSSVAKYHREHFGSKPMHEFAADFAAAIDKHWDPEAWADAFAAAGARYVVLVTKHHDGFCLWPTRVPNPKRPGFNLRRDVVGELARAVRARGIRFGVYYSGGLDWTFDARPIANIGDLIAAAPGGAYPRYADAHFRELLERYRPDVLWNDISWAGDRGSLLRLFADYYNGNPDGLVNDRWTPVYPLGRLLRVAFLRNLFNRRVKAAVLKHGGALTPPPALHSDTRTPEYATFAEIRAEKWECVRGMDKSFGFNRASLPGDFLSREALIHSLVDIASKNGNLLLNVGPRGEDAQIPDPQLERLRWLGSFTRRYGEALYGTHPWQRAEGETAEGWKVRFTARGETLYAWLLGAPRAQSTIELLGLRADSAQLAGGPALALERTGRGTRFLLPELPDEPAHAIALRGVSAL